MSLAAGDGRDARRVAEAEEFLRAAALLVRAGTSSGPPTWKPDAPRPRALVLDDIDLMVPTLGPQQLINVASEGDFVVATVPRHLLLFGTVILLLDALVMRNGSECQVLFGFVPSDRVVRLVCDHHFGRVRDRRSRVAILTFPLQSST